MADLKNRLKNLSPEQKALLEKKLREKAIKKSEEDKIQIRENTNEYPMSSAQERLWFLNQLNPDSSFYYMPAALKIKGNLNVEALEDSLKIIFKRHEVLQSVFIQTDNGPKQNKLEFNFTLATEYISDQKREIKDLLNEEANEKFEIEKGPLFRVKLFILNDEESILLFTLHHIIADGWSIGIIINELSVLYETKCRNNTIELDNLPIQYFDYADWQKKHLTEDIKNNEIEYWKNKLSGMPQVLELPTDKSRPASQTFNGDRVKIEIPLDLHLKIKEIGGGNNASPFMTYLTILEILLFRFTNQDDFGIGTVSTGRPVLELKSIIGFFVNTIVNRAKLESDQTFLELLKNVRDTALESFEHQTLPFESVVENVLVEKSISHTPLFQVMYDYQESPLNNLKLPGISLELLDQEISSSKFDLLFVVEDLNDKLKISIEYNTDIFNLSTISSLSNIILNLIKGIVQNPNEEISRLPIISEIERNRIKNEFNKTETNFHLDLCIHEIFEGQANKFPNLIAVRYNDNEITYENLNEKANQLANFLISNNIGHNSIVGLYIEPSIEMIIGILAILKASASYLPLDPKFPKERIVLMTQNTNVDSILYKNQLSTQIKSLDLLEVNIDIESKLFESRDTENPNLESNLYAAAYIIFTSGSTGLPKGVVCNHLGVINLLNDFHSRKKLSIGFKQSLWTTFNFDVSVYEIFYPLLFGGELNIIPDEIRILDEKLFAWLSNRKIESTYLPPFMLDSFSDWLENKLNTSSLNKILVGVEPIKLKILASIKQKISSVYIINGYGPSETTICSTAYDINTSDDSNDITPIGMPISNTKVFILDNQLNIVPQGVVGELFISSIGISQGYFNKPKLTAEKFIPNLFSEIEGDRLYSTGDLVRLSEEGALNYIGRVDNQVKIRGYRIELGEIESNLKEISFIKDAAVVVLGEKALEKTITAFLVLKPDEKFSKNLVTAKLATVLPNYMLPNSYSILSKIPLTPNGKVDKKSLILLNVDEQIEERKIVAPRNKFEEYLSGVWQEILKVEKVSIHDSFFDLGGNSLQAAVLINRVQKELGVEIQVQSIFLAPTISDFSTYAQEYFSDLISEKFNDIPQNIDLELKIEKTEILTESKINEFNKIIIPIIPRVSKTEKKNSRAIFILSPPRSGSTLLRVMLEGHDKLFSPPELDLLSFNTLNERKEKLSGDYSLWLEATVRAIMELKNCSSDEAEKIMDGFEKENMSVKDFYGELQEWAGDRIIVDKTPTYALDKKVLNRAEEYFENPLYIHLTRNPYASTYSFIEAKLDKNFFRYKNSFSRRELASLIWLTCHKNTLEFLEKVPEERQIRISFEDLVLNPEPIMKDLSDFLGLEYDEKLINPYDGTRMTDAIDKNSQMVGDFKFYLRNKIDPNVVNRWKNFHKENFLCEQSIKIAKQLNYNLTEEKICNVDRKTFRYSSIKKISRDSEIPLSYAQQRLWFLDQLEPGKATYNIPGVVELKGNLNVEVLEKSINKIIERHESLRTSFSVEEGKAKQIITNNISIKLDIIDLSLSQNGKREIEIDEIIKEDSQMPFDLSVTPLLRIKLLVVGQDDNIFLLTMHHIISDGWSSEVFVRELSILYSSYIYGENPKLEKLEFQYADFSVWQRNWLQGEVYNKHIEYWKNKLVGVPQLLELPTDFNRPAIQKQKGKRVQFEIDPTLVQDLSIIASKENVTLYVLFLAAFNILLHKYSKSEDILIGTPVAGRNRNEIEPIIGLFVNTLVLRNDFSKDYTIKHFLQNVKQVFVEAMNHQEIPFEKLIDELKIERSLSHTPLFQVMFVFNNSPVANIELPELSIQPKAIDLGTSKFDINLVLTRRNEKIRGSLEYDLNLFKDNTINNFISHYLNILSQIIELTHSSIKEISLIKNEEKNKIISELNNTKIINSLDGFVHNLFERNAKKFKYEIAVILNENKITYDELNKRSNQFAHYLIKRNVGKDFLVGICVERSIDMLIGMLSILKAGGAYVPIDPLLPPARINYMIEDSNLGIILTNQDLIKLIEQSGSELICFDRDWADISKENNDNIHIDIFEDNLAYVIYTSGSTGKPKGTLITHKGLNNYLSWCMHQYPLTEGRGSLVHSTISFDATITSIFPSLLVGKSLVLLSGTSEIDELGEKLMKYKEFSLLKITPAHLDILAYQITPSDASKITSSLVIGGEALSSEQIEFWKKYSPGTKLYNEYGPTETTVGCIVFEASKWIGEGSVPIGKIIPNTIIYILDENFEIVPSGLPGELYIGGNGVARGYLNRSDLTAEKYLPDPFGDTRGNRIYKTGDYVKTLEDGNLIFLGRVDDQIKLKGFRIELGEIENLLLKLEFISEVAIIIQEDEQNIKRIAAFYVEVEQSNIMHEQLRKYLGENLPEYMIPAFFEKLEEMPLTYNGKINKEVLAKIKTTRTKNNDYLAPESSREKTLIKIWQQILRVEKIGITDNFFELGGDSILGIQVIAKANQAGIKISPKNLFQFPTIQGLASVAESTKTIVAEQGLVSGEVDLTPIQDWFFLEEFNNQNHWNQSILLEVNDNLEIDLLRQTITKLIEHHDALRMRFSNVNGNWIQKYSSINSNIPFESYDLSSVNAENKILEIEKLSEEIQSSLDIESGPIFKCSYFNLGDNWSNRILIVAHHLIIDGVSWRILTEDIQNIYSQLKLGAEVTLPTKTTSFKYWSKRLFDLLEDKEFTEQNQYWNKISAELKVNKDELISSNINTEASAKTLTSSLDKNLTETLIKEVPKKYHTEINDVLLTALVLTNSISNGKRKINVSLEGHGREDLFDDVDISRTIGWFTSLYPIVLDLENTMTRVEALKTVKEQLRKIPNHGIGYGILRHLFSNKIDYSDLPHLPEISFNYLGQFNQSSDEKAIFRVAKENKSNERAFDNKRAFQMDITGSIINGKLSLNWMYNENKYPKEEIQLFSDTYIQELNKLIIETMSESGGYTPSDFNDADLDDQDLDSIFSELNEEFDDE
ncbi:MAG: amino acid adenylation domain-containing protein [Ignavibacteriae bacterium]|nr:amino acid adenylation domain-containing protein [Ignavibacteriota bacterium]